MVGLDRARELMEEALAAPGPLVFLTGAGVSAASGIPTFRGPEGYWQVGAREYFPEELATRAAFGVMPDVIWGWYLYRRGVCRAAAPNPAHEALASAEAALGDRFLLVTQNVDGLHLRAGNTPARTWQIHGNIDFMRCRDGCHPALHPVPLPEAWARGRLPDAGEKARLTCPRCGGPARPHVLWFDEYYDEENFRFESALRAADRAALLVVAGTSGSTNLPLHMGRRVAARRGRMIVVNLEPNDFSRWAEASGAGVHLPLPAVEALPTLVEPLLARGTRPA